MQRKLLLLLVGFILGLTAAYFYLRHRAPVPPRPSATPPPATAPAEVPIQDGKTINFSSGQPQVQDTAEDRAALEKAKHEMDEASKDVTFAPTKPAEPAAAKP